MEAKVFSSGDKAMHFTPLLWCSATKTIIGHCEDLPSLMVRVFGNFEQNLSATRECSGANGSAER